MCLGRERRNSQYKEKRAAEKDFPAITSLMGLAELALGGPTKVIKSESKILSTAMIHSLLVALPILYPLVVVLMSGDSYLINTDTALSLARVTIVLAFVESLFYLIVGRELLRNTETLGQNEKEQISAIQDWVYSVFNMSFKLLYSTAVLILVGCLIQLVILVLLSLTVDPYRSLAVILGFITVFFCESSTLSALAIACGLLTTAVMMRTDISTSVTSINRIKKTLGDKIRKRYYERQERMLKATAEDKVQMPTRLSRKKVSPDSRHTTELVQPA